MQATGLKLHGQRFQLSVQSPGLSRNLETKLEIAPIALCLESSDGQSFAS